MATRTDAHHTGHTRRAARRPTRAPADRREGSARGLADRFRESAEIITHAVGTPWALGVAALIVVAWGVTGPVFGFSNTWQLVINTGTTIVTFLMVFVIQASQNRDSRAIHLKLDELLRATKGARNRLIDAEHEVERDMERDERDLQRRARPRRG